MKLLAGGGIDYFDAKAILEVQGPSLDEVLLMESCRQARVLNKLALIRKSLQNDP